MARSNTQLGFRIPLLTDFNITKIVAKLFLWISTRSIFWISLFFLTTNLVLKIDAGSSWSYELFRQFGAVAAGSTSYLDRIWWLGPWFRSDPHLLLCPQILFMMIVGARTVVWVNVRLNPFYLFWKVNCLGLRFCEQFTLRDDIISAWSQLFGSRFWLRSRTNRNRLDIVAKLIFNLVLSRSRRSNFCLQVFSASLVFKIKFWYWLLTHIIGQFSLVVSWT